MKKGGCVRKGSGKQEWGEQEWGEQEWGRAVPYGCRRSSVSY